jgi:transcriptional regulator with XRE-family HTH domain
MPRTAASQVTAQLVGAEIRRSRRELGLSQAELARRLDVSPPYVAKVEAGRANLTIGQLGNFAAALGTALDVRLQRVEREVVHLPETPSLSATGTDT